MKKFNVFFYTIKQGFRNLKKNRMFTFASIGTISACLFIFGLFYFIAGNFQYMIHKIETSVSSTVFFEEGISKEQINTIGEVIKNRPEVEEVRYISAEEAWEEFKKELDKNPDSQIGDTFGEDNPLADSASYEVY
ncbi:MAG: permease-like cell division protein FtsX, partial [Lachnoclostridium sp.]|nr:permease-like cell division protein FtsX [Lachnoclostridium sp.]